MIRTAVTVTTKKLDLGFFHRMLDEANVSCVLTGESEGADLVIEYCFSRSIPFTVYPDVQMMIDTSDELIAFWDGHTPGDALDSITYANLKDIPITIYW